MQIIPLQLYIEARFGVLIWAFWARKNSCLIGLELLLMCVNLTVEHFCIKYKNEKKKSQDEKDMM